MLTNDQSVTDTSFKNIKNVCYCSKSQLIWFLASYISGVNQMIHD